MGSNPLYNATTVKDGRSVQVYKLGSGNWCDFSNCTTQYKPDEVKILGKVK